MDSGGEYQYLLERKDKGVIKDKFKFKTLSKRVNRINNLIKRFHPEYICVLRLTLITARSRQNAERDLIRKLFI